MQYDKRPVDIQTQLIALQASGINCPDKPKALRYLSNISAYRLKPYKQFLLTHNPPVEFDQLIALYVFDKRIRLLFFDAIERIEVAVRAQFINCYGVRYGDHWYLEDSHFKNLSVFTDFQQEVAEISDPKKRRKQSSAIQHYFQKYTSGPASPPCSMLMESISFGTVSRLFKALVNNEGKRDIAQHFGVKYQLLESWLHSLNYLRNSCAHHARVWNHPVSIVPLKPKQTQDKWLDISQVDDRKIYLMLTIVCYLLRRISPQSTFQERFLQTIADEGNPMLYQDMGFPRNWQYDSFWQA